MAEWIRSAQSPQARRRFGQRLQRALALCSRMTRVGVAHTAEVLGSIPRRPPLPGIENTTSRSGTGGSLDYLRQTLSSDAIAGRHGARRSCSTRPAARTGEPQFHELEPAGRVAASGRRSPADGLSGSRRPRLESGRRIVHRMREPARVRTTDGSRTPWRDDVDVVVATMTRRSCWCRDGVRIARYWKGGRRPGLRRTTKR